jgi:hypothetical protein
MDMVTSQGQFTASWLALVILIYLGRQSGQASLSSTPQSRERHLGGWSLLRCL